MSFCCSSVIPSSPNSFEHRRQVVVGFAAAGHQCHGLFQRGGTAVVEVGGRVGHVAERRHAELAHVVVFARDGLAPFVRRLLVHADTGV